MCPRNVQLLPIALMLTACSAPPVKTPDAPVQLTEESLLAAQRAGYSLVTRNGEQVLCRRDAQTGTRLQHTTTCLTASDWARMRSDSKDTLRDLTRDQKPKRQ